MASQGGKCSWCGWVNTPEAMDDNGGLPYCCATAERAGHL